MLKQWNVTLSNFLQVLVWTLLAILILPQSSHFLYDEAYFYNQSMDVASRHLFAPYGPFISGTHPTALTPGGGLFFLLSVPFFFGKSPHLGSIWMILFSSAGILALDASLKRWKASAVFRFLTVFFLTWSAWHNWLVDRIWNVDVYWGLSLFLLSIVIRILADSQQKISTPLRYFFLAGMLSAFALQVHLGAILLIAVLGVLVLVHARSQITVRNTLIALFAAFILYVPYFYSEFLSGFQNTFSMRTAHELRGTNRQAIVKSLASPLIYISQFKNPYQWIGALKRNALDVVTFLVSFFSFYLVYLGLGQKSPFRLLWVVCWLLSPIYFFLTQRPFFDHYVASLIPFYFIILALGATQLYQRNEKGKKIVLVYCLIYVVVASIQSFGAAVLTPSYPTISDQIEATQAALREAPLNHIEISAGDPQAYVIWAIARNVLGVTPYFNVKDVGASCSVQHGDAGTESKKVIGPNSFFSCKVWF
jgi:hypothetical protein